MSSGKPAAVGNMHVFVPCLTDVVNKKFTSSLSWNNPLSEAPIGESYILIIGSHVDAKEKHSLYVEVVYNM